MHFDDARRLRALDDYRVFDSPEEPVFDNIAQLTAKIFHAPISLVSLVGKERQRFKAHYGLAVTETPREYAFCDHAIRADAPLVVPDTHLDSRFSENPLVLGDPYIRAYCGVPLRTPEGHGLGTLCVIDRAAREFHPGDVAMLELLARHVELELELRRRLALLEENLVRSRERQSSNELLVAMVVHDMRSPLTVISMLATTVVAGDDESRADLEVILSETERLRRMLKDMLDVSLNEVGGLRPRRQLFLIAPVAHEIAARAHRGAGAGAHRIRVEDPDEPTFVDGDPELISRVLENLVTNAFQYATHEAEVVIALRAEGSDLVRAQVRDRGPVIPEEERTRIFEALAQGALPSAHRGYGLGLTFCRLAVEAHGGTIRVRPNLDGVGNCFEFDLPGATRANR